MAVAKTNGVTPVPFDITEELKGISLGLKKNAHDRAMHLTQLALCSLKYLITRGESDTLRLAATKQLLELPMVQARLGTMARSVRDYHQHVHVDATSKALVEKLTLALTNGNTQGALDLLLPTKSVDISPKPLETNQTT